MKLVTTLAAALIAVAIATAVAFGAARTTPGGLPVIDVTMDGSSISVDGSLLSGAVDIHATASGAAGSPIFIHLNSGVAADQLVTRVHAGNLNDPNVISDYGAFVFDKGVGLGTHDVMTKLPPGDYVAFDAWKNNPADWPYTTFTIAENGSPMSLPPAPQWQKSVEFKFRGPATLHVGQAIRVSNVGWVVHMMGAIIVKDEATGRRLAALLRAGKDQAAIKLALGFESLFDPLSHGAVQQFTLDAKPGWYVMACFMDTQDGREHTRLGMVKLVHLVN